MYQGHPSGFCPDTLNLFYRRSTSPATKLRVGLLLDHWENPAILAKVIEDIQASNFASVELVVMHEPASAEPVRRSKLDLLRDPARRRQLLFSRYEKWDRGKFQALPESQRSPEAPVDCRPMLAGVDAIAVTPIGKRFVHRFPEDAVAQIQERRLDVILRFGFNILRGGILRAARYGVWSYHHGDNAAYRGGPPLFWEVAEDNPESGVILQVLEEALDDGLVLRKSVFPTVNGVSWIHNRFGPYWASQHFVIETLWRLHNFGWEALSKQSAKAPGYTGKKEIYRAPSNGETAAWLAGAFARKAARRLVRGAPVQPHWKLGLRRLPSEDSAIAAPLDLAGFQWIDSPRGHFWADPFLFEWQNRTYLFIEDLPYATSKGVLAVAELGEPGAMKFETCLEEPFHLSYPAVFAHEGRVYMIPETWDAGEIRLYVAEDFPRRWKQVKVLLPIHAVDSTPWFDGEGWWLFVTTAAPAGYCPSLLLFSAKTLEGDWQYHPANPLSGDLRLVRNAGAIFRANGKLYRPSQSGRGGYGADFSLNEITELSPTAYRERIAATTRPTGVKDLFATHTYGRSRNWEVVDGCFRVPASQVRD